MFIISGVAIAVLLPPINITPDGTSGPTAGLVTDVTVFAREVLLLVTWTPRQL